MEIHTRTEQVHGLRYECQKSGYGPRENIVRRCRHRRIPDTDIVLVFPIYDTNRKRSQRPKHVNSAPYTVLFPTVNNNTRKKSVMDFDETWHTGKYCFGTSAPVKVSQTSAKLGNSTKW